MKIGEEYQRHFYYTNGACHFWAKPKCLFIIDYKRRYTPWMGENILAQSNDAALAWQPLSKLGDDRLVYTQGYLVELFILDDEIWGKK